MTTDTDHTSRIDLTLDGTTWWLHLDGYLDEAAVSRLDDAIRALSVQRELAVVVRVTSSRYAPGALTLLRQVLRGHHISRTRTNPLTVWTDEPAIRAALPAAMIHTPWTDNPDATPRPATTSPKR
jgi:hypothetical protein